MIEIVVKFRVDSVNEMQDEVKAFLDALQEYSGTGAADEEVGNGYKYDDGSDINDALRRLCKRVGADDWRDISLENLDLPVMAYNRLNKAEIHDLRELVSFSEQKLMDIRKFGAIQIERTKEELRKLGLQLAED